MVDAAIGHRREQVFDFFDAYAYQRKEEIDQRRLGENVGLLKSYVMETSHYAGHPDVARALATTGWTVDQLGTDELYYVRGTEGEIGYAEPLSNRHFALHSFRKNDPIDRAVRRTVQETSDLDSLWLAGDAFDRLWKHVVLNNTPGRFVSIKFEHEARFEIDSGEDFWSDDQDEPPLETEDADHIEYEHRAARSSFVERADRLARLLPTLQSAYPAFRAIRMLRLPGDERGGYDLYDWGKMTYRAPSFREGRSLLVFIAQVYERVTKMIEEATWMSAERVDISGQAYLSWQGAPVVCRFREPLSQSTFQSFVDTTFQRGQGPLRLWGNPIRLGSRKVHVYGLDLHLWQQIYMELTPERFLFVIPQGTCGNTIHRLLTNIQRFVAPDVELDIAGTSYGKLFDKALFGREIDD